MDETGLFVFLQQNWPRSQTEKIDSIKLQEQIGFLYGLLGQ